MLQFCKVKVAILFKISLYENVANVRKITRYTGYRLIWRFKCSALNALNSAAFVAKTYIGMAENEHQKDFEKIIQGSPLEISNAHMISG